MKPNGAVIWRGPSQFTGAPTYVVVTGLARPSANPKTGDMLQAWILPVRESPPAAVKSGGDAAVCGTCPRRPLAAAKTGLDPCYVLTFQGPRSVAAASYPDAPARGLAAGRRIRLGAWGDPAAVPTEVWEQLTDGAAGWTGYSHAFRTCDSNLRHYCMASCDSDADLAAARALGWRAFLVRPQETSVEAARAEGLVVCPASKERGHRTTCAQCLLCSGSGERSGLRPAARAVSVVIAAH